MHFYATGVIRHCSYFEHETLLNGLLTARLCFCSSYLCIVHSYGTLLESDLTYAPLRPDQMDNGALDMSLDEDTSSMDEIPQKCPLKPQKKTKGKALVRLLLVRA